MVQNNNSSHQNKRLLTEASNAISAISTMRNGIILTSGHPKTNDFNNVTAKNNFQNETQLNNQQKNCQTSSQTKTIIQVWQLDIEK